MVSSSKCDFSFSVLETDYLSEIKDFPDVWLAFEQYFFGNKK